MQKQERLHAFHRVVAGRANFFRYKDHLDFNSTGYDGSKLGDGRILPTSASDQAARETATETVFQLQKTYTFESASYVRDIFKPVAGTVKVAIDSVEGTEGVDWTVDTTTGLLTILSGAGGGSPPLVTAGYEFDVPCQFMIDHLPTTLGTFGVGTSLNIGVEEIRLDSVL